MSLKEKNVLFFTRTMSLGGTENVILQMCEILKPHVNKIVVCSCGGLNVNKLDEMRIKHYEIPDIDCKSPKVLLQVFHKVYKIIHNENITIVHTHHRMATFYMHFLKKLCKVKVISTLHGSFSDKKVFTKLIYKNINIIACGSIVKDVFIKNYKINENNITVIHNAIKKEPRKDIDIGIEKDVLKSSKKIAYVGRLVEEKGVNLLIEAMSIILKNVNNTSLIIVGEGPLKERLEKQAEELNIRKYIFFLGYRDEIQGIIQQMDLVVLPSYTEGLPLTPIEAFACGKPVVATAADGTVEIVKDNKNGFLVPVGNVDLLAEKIQEVLQNEKLYKRMCVEAKKTYEKNYNFEVFRNKILEYYKLIVK